MGKEPYQKDSDCRVNSAAPRVIRDGKVAVIYQPHRGLGWFTEHGIEDLVFSPDIVEMIERDAPGLEIHNYCQRSKFGWSVMETICYGLDIKWVCISKKFRILEHNGREMIVLKSTDKWLTA